MPPVPRAGFTIVEALVATAIVGIAATALAASLTATGAMRARAAARNLVAAIARAQVAELSGRACAAPDTGGVISVGGAVGTWAAQRAGAGWAFSDSVRAGRADVVLFAGSVACRR